MAAHTYNAYMPKKVYFRPFLPVKKAFDHVGGGLKRDRCEQQGDFEGVPCAEEAQEMGEDCLGHGGAQ